MWALAREVVAHLDHFESDGHARHHGEADSRHLAGRASASFANAIGSSNMVAPSWKGYEDTVEALGRHPWRLWTMRERLIAMRETAPFFDLNRLALGQQRLASAMWGVHASGRRPMHVIAARPLAL